jgi:phospholipid/cholesterol/gamma-HCH transport system substrate-binding protein
MEAKREQALVGLFVLVAASLLIITLFLLSSSFRRGEIPYHAYFKNAGGLGPGSEVHYAGGPPVGRIQSVRPDPLDPSRMKIDFSVADDIPVKTDSKAIITNTSPLGDNFLGIVAGSPSAPRAAPDATLKSVEYRSFAEISDMLADLGPDAKELVRNLNQRVIELKTTLERVNNLLNDENQRNIAGSLADLHGMLKEDRPLVHSTLTNVNATSEKIGPLIDDFKKTSAKASDALAHIDETITENKSNLHQAIIDLRAAMANANSVLDKVNQLTNSNTENLDEIIENLRDITDNMNSFTETIKTRPYTLIRASGVKEHEPGKPPPK